MKKKFTKITSCLLCLAMLLSMAGPALAAIAEDDALPEAFFEDLLDGEEIIFSPDGDDAVSIDAPDAGEDDLSFAAGLPTEDLEASPFEATEEYEIYPTPHSVDYPGGTVILPTTMKVVYGDGIDDYTKARADEAFKAAGVTLSTASNSTLVLRVSIKGDDPVTTATANLFDKYDAYKLVIDDAGVTVIGKDTDAAFYGLTTVKRILQQVQGRTVRKLTVEDYADVALRGFIEGYYGNPWTVADRAALMKFGGEIKQNIYFYAPKNDPKHSSKWRELYTQDELNTLIKPLAEAGNKSKCYYGFALHPFWADVIDYTNDTQYAADLKVLKQKFMQVIDVGVRQIAVLGDDKSMPAVGAAKSYNRLMTDLTEWVTNLKNGTVPAGDVGAGKTIPDMKTTIPFCPDDYMSDASSTQMQDMAQSFTPNTAAGEYKMPASVPIIQTGGEIWGQVSHSFLTAYRNNMHGGTFMWINWPCSDHSKDNLTMGAHGIVLHNDLTQDDIDTLQGIMLNPMQQSEPSKAAIFQAADYAWNIWNGTDSEDRIAQVWENTFKYVDHESAIETDESLALKELSKHMIHQYGNVGWHQDYPESFELSPKLSAFQTKLEAGTLEAADVAAMRKEFDTLHKAAVLYKNKTTGNLRILGTTGSEPLQASDPWDYPYQGEQMAPWLDCWEEFSQANLDLLDALALSLDNADGSNNVAIVNSYLSGQLNLNASKEHKFHYYNDKDPFFEIRYAKVGSMFIVPFTNKLLSVVAEEAKAILDPSPAVLVETIITSRTDTPTGGLDAIRDGDETTAAVFTNPTSLSEGDYVGLRYNKAIELDSVRFVLGDGSAKNTFGACKLQYTENGTTWVDVPLAKVTETTNTMQSSWYGTKRVASIEATGLGLSVRGVRLVSTEGVNDIYIGVKEIYINGQSGQQPDEPAETGAYSYTAAVGGNMIVAPGYGQLSYLSDGDESTICMFKGSSSEAVPQNGYLQLDLGSAKPIGSITIKGDPSKVGDAFVNAQIQYAMPGAATATVVENCVVNTTQGSFTVDLSDRNITAQTLFIVNAAATADWVRVAELTIMPPLSESDILDKIAYQSDAVKKIVDPVAVLEDDLAQLSAANVVLRPNEFVGIVLPRIRAVKDIVADFTYNPNVVLKVGVTEDELEEVNLRGRAVLPPYARYVRLENTGSATVSFTLNELSVQSEEFTGIHLDSCTIGGATNTDDARYKNETGNWFDGSVDTKAKFCGAQVTNEHVTFDLGQTRSIKKLQLAVRDNQLDYPRAAKVQIAMTADGPWTDVITIDTPGDANTSALAAGWEPLAGQPNFVELSGELADAQDARYLRLIFTANFSGRWLELNEIIINDSEYVRTVNDPTFDTDPIEPSAEFTPDKMRDGDLTTGFRPNMAGRTSGSLIYRLSDETSIGQLNIIEGAASHAKVFIRPVGEVDFREVDTLEGGLTQIKLDEDITGVAEVMLAWGPVTPTIYEIFTVSREQAQAAGEQASSGVETVPINSYSGSDRTINFDDNWKFNLGDASGAGELVYNDSSWRTVNLPHDYSIEGEYTDKGEAESGYLIGGVGWYRKSFTVDPSWEGKVVTLDFGGVYMDSEVYLNGVKLGEHHYGYTPFSFVLTGLNYTGENVIAVKTDDAFPSSRWYSGAGIYRSVHLTVTSPVHVAKYGTKVETTNTGAVTVKTTVENSSASAANVTVEQAIYELDGTTYEKKGAAVATTATAASASPAAGGTADVTQTLSVTNPNLWNSWDKGTPNLYVLVTTVKQGSTVLDTYETEFGFRTIEFTMNDGFKLNGQNVKLKGVCQHHDQGALGAEAWYRALERQVDILKDMGCNAIRVTHNPAADELIEICNRKGVLIIDEAFDTWTIIKNQNSNDFSRWFNVAITDDNALVGKSSGDIWSKFVLRTMIKRDMNNPCVIMYSLGNELYEGNDNGGDTSGYGTIAEMLISFAKAIDTTRPLTYGQNARNTADSKTQIADKLHTAGGVIGLNYRRGWDIATAHDQWGWLVYASETVSHVNSRGVYNIKGNASLNSDKLITSYDKSAVGWGNVASDGWYDTIIRDYSAGEFIWTGFDYIGEPTPKNNTTAGWADGENSPKNSYFGAIDTNGLPKDNYWLYRAMWNEKSNTLHILPTWDREDLLIENGNVEVVVYTNAPMVKLYLNGNEVGSATSTLHTTAAGHTYRTFNSGTGAFVQQTAEPHQTLYATFNVPYDAGTLRAVACDASGNELTNWDSQGRSEVTTTTGASKLRVEADRATIKNDGRDLSYITISVTDAAGNIVNGAKNEITVNVDGDGVFMGLDNGVQPDHTSFLSKTRAAGAGQLVAIVQSTKEAGSFTLTATADGFDDASVTVSTSGVASTVTDKDPVSYDLAKTIYVQLYTEPDLPETVIVTLRDGSEVEKNVTWDTSYDRSLLSTAGNAFTIDGAVEGCDFPVSVGVVVLDDIAALLNYSAAIKTGERPTLPAFRPAVMSDGTVVPAQFSVEWKMPADTVFNHVGLVEVPGTAEAFGKEYTVTAFVRVANDEIAVGHNVAGAAADVTLNGAADPALSAINDGDAATAWTGSGAVALGYDTAFSLHQLKLTYADSVPTTRPTIEISGDSNLDSAVWEEVTVPRTVNGLTATYQLPSLQSVVLVRVTYGSQVSLAELELITGSSVFDVGSTAELDDLKINGESPAADQLAAKLIRSSVVTATLDPVSSHNVACTILPEDSESRIFVVTESEDHSSRAKYTVVLDPDYIAADDYSRDYPYNKTTAYAPSERPQSSTSNPNEGPVSFVKDDNLDTLWHSAYDEDLTGQPDKRYIQLTLDETTELVALRYKPRKTIANGIVTKYRVEVSTDGTNYTPVAEGDWAHDTTWKIAIFGQHVLAKHVRLYGVETKGGSQDIPNKFMSCAELRVVVADEKVDLSQAIVTLSDPDMDNGTFHWRNVEIIPETVTVTLFGQRLVEGRDYVLSYEHNTDPGTAYVYARAASGSAYQGSATATFSIVRVPVNVEQFMPLTIQSQEGVVPELPGQVWASMSDGHLAQVDVEWNAIPSSDYTLTSGQLSKTVTVTGRADVDNLGENVTAPKVNVIIIPALSVDAVTTITSVGVTPTLPETVTVQFKNGTSRECLVTWNLTGLDFSTPDVIVSVPGTITGIGSFTATTASVRVGESSGMEVVSTGTNLARNTDSAANFFPMALGFVSSGNNNPYQAIKGQTNASTDAANRWSDWERNTHHTDPKAWLAVAFEASGDIPADRGQNQQFTLVPRLVNKAKVMFVDEGGGTSGDVTFPADYKLQYYTDSTENLTFDTRLTAQNVLTDGGNGHVREWGNDHPLNNNGNWADVTVSGSYPAVPSANGTMLEIDFEPVETAIIRVLCTPKSNKWTGIQALEVYEGEVRLAPPVAHSDFEITSITVGDGANTRTLTAADFDAGNVAEVELPAIPTDGSTLYANRTNFPPINVAVTNNAAVSVKQTFLTPSRATITITSEDGTNQEEYTIRFTREGQSASHDVRVTGVHADLLTVDPTSAEEGETVTLITPLGYEAVNVLATILSDGDNNGMLVDVRNGTFIMPNGSVTIAATVQPITYTITYDLDGGSFTSENRSTYNVENRTFTLNAPTREGYTFVGWVGTELVGVNETVTITEGSYGDRVYTAVWRANATPGGTTTGGGSSGGIVSEAPATDVVTTKTDPVTGATTVTTTTPAGLVTQVTTAPDGQQTATVHVPQNSASSVTAAMPALDVSVSPEVTVKNNNTRPVSVVIPTNGSDSVVAVRLDPDGTETIIPLSVTDNGELRFKTQPGTETVRIMDNKKTFEDVPDTHWAAKAVTFTASRELFLGTTPVTFAPSAPMTRAMMTTVLWRMAEKPDSAADSLFSDVRQGSYYEDAVRWGVETGVVKGTDVGFEPDAPLTRETLAVFLYRAAGSPAVVDELPRRFTDGDQVSPWAQAAMIWCVENNIINGRAIGTLSPKDVASRAEVATMLQRFVNKQV